MSPVSEDTAQKLLQTVLSMHADVTLIKARQQELAHRLFGNGQPGEMANVKDEIEELKLWRAREAGSQSANRKWSAYISGAVGAAVSYAFEYLWHRSMR